jgi:outer membrane protein TolC
MISARIAVPLPVFKGRKQSQQRGETEAVLASLEAELQDEENRILARVAELHSNLERARTELALLKAALLPQAHAAQEAALAAYRVGNVDLLTLLENQAALFDYETEYFRLLSGFATDLAELTRAVGKEVAA